MNTLKKITALLTLSALAVGLTVLAHGQAAGPTGGQLSPPAHRRPGRPPIIQALEKVKPTKDELAKVRGLMKTRNENVKAFRDAHKGDRAGLRTFAGDQQKTLLTGIKGVLTPDQWDTFQTELKKIYADMRGNRRSGKGRNGGAAGGNPPTPPIKGV